MDVLLSDAGIIICEVIVILIMITIIAILTKEKRKYLKNLVNNRQKQQDDALNQKLMNNKGKNR